MPYCQPLKLLNIKKIRNSDHVSIAVFRENIGLFKMLFKIFFKTKKNK